MPPHLSLIPFLVSKRMLDGFPSIRSQSYFHAVQTLFCGVTPGHRGRRRRRRLYTPSPPPPRHAPGSRRIADPPEIVPSFNFSSRAQGAAGVGPREHPPPRQPTHVVYQTMPSSRPRDLRYLSSSTSLARGLAPAFLVKDAPPPSPDLLSPLGCAYHAFLS